MPALEAFAATFTASSSIAAIDAASLCRPPFSYHFPNAAGMGKDRDAIGNATECPVIQ
jgi:hypothetical protein